MTNPADLLAAVARVAQAAERHRGRGLTEQDTKNALIEPVLAALGWPKDDLDLVRSEYRHTSKYNPVDYALLSGGRPVMLVEAKALDVKVDDHKVVSQVVAYAANVGVAWALVTNGADWHLYSALALLDADRKRVFAVNVAQPGAIEWLPWLAPSRLSGNLLGNLWHLVHAERQVREVVNRLFTERNDALVSLVAAEGRIPTADVALALQVLQPALRPANMDAIHRLVSGGGQHAVAPALAAPPTPAVPSTSPSANAGQAKASTPPSSPAPFVSPAPSPVVITAPSLPSLPPPPVPGECPITAKPTPGAKPARLLIHDQAWEVATWGELLLVALRHLHTTGPDRYEAIFTAPEFEGRKARSFQRAAEGLRSPREIAGGFVDVNRSAESIVGLVAALVTFFGMESGAVRYAVREG